MADPKQPGNFGEYRRLLLSELERLGREVDELKDCSNEIKTLSAAINAEVRVKIENLEKAVAGIEKSLDDLDKEQIAQGRLLTTLQVRSGLWGAAAGILTALAAYFMRRI